MYVIKIKGKSCESWSNKVETQSIMKTTELQHDLFNYAFKEMPDSATIELLEELPGRWGRMPPLSRLVVVETGRILKENGLTIDSRKLNQQGQTVGLIGGTRYGSLTTDIDFAETLKQAPELASPALFGYTLANIPLAEAANHYGLTGPVYAIMDRSDPLSSAVSECERNLNQSDTINCMLACHFDDVPSESGRHQLQITFKIIH